MRIKIILTFVVTLIVIISGSFFFVKGGLSSIGVGKATSWYAVHLNNGQVYFGHIARISDDTITISDTRYLETFEAGDSAVSESKNFAIQQAPKQIYSLVRRGDEKSLATDHTLHINRSAVLFWEKLSADSDIVSSINAVAGQKSENSK
ncbi:MAG: hypothetical protein WAV98_03520 [Minisyncoccia bacterium]